MFVNIEIHQDIHACDTYVLHSSVRSRFSKRELLACEIIALCLWLQTATILEGAQ